MMDKLTRSIINYRKHEYRDRVIRLPSIWWTIAIIILSIVILLASWFTASLCGWLSNLFMSMSVGCFTGLTLYFLSNLRNNREGKLRKEVQLLTRVLNILRDILGLKQLCLSHTFREIAHMNMFDISQKMEQLLDDLEESRNRIPLSVYDTVLSQGYDPADYDNIRSYQYKLREAKNSTEIKEVLDYIIKELTPLADQVQLELQTREDQLDFIESHFI